MALAAVTKLGATSNTTENVVRRGFATSDTRDTDLSATMSTLSLGDQMIASASNGGSIAICASPTSEGRCSASTRERASFCPSEPEGAGVFP